jgi:hypothetical protein
MYDNMVDRTSTNDSMLLTKSPSVTSINMHRHDSQTEMNNYYINYIDDRTSMSVIEENSCRLEVSQLVEEVIKKNNPTNQIQLNIKSIDIY